MLPAGKRKRGLNVVLDGLLELIGECGSWKEKSNPESVLRDTQGGMP